MTASIKEYLTMPAKGKPDLNNTTNGLEAARQVHYMIKQHQHVTECLRQEDNTGLVVVLCEAVVLGLVIFIWYHLWKVREYRGRKAAIEQELSEARELVRTKDEQLNGWEAALKQELSEAREEIASQMDLNDKQARDIEERDAELSEAREKDASQMATIDQQARKVEERDAELWQRKKDIIDLQYKVHGKDVEISKVKLHTREDEAAKQTLEFEQLSEDHYALSAKARDLSEKNADLVKKNAQIKTEQERQQKKMTTRDQQVKDLSELVSKLNACTQKVKEEMQQVKKERCRFEKEAAEAKEISLEIEMKAQNLENELSKSEKQVTALKKDLADSECCLNAHGTLLLGETMQLQATHAELTAANETISVLRQRVTGLEAKDKLGQQISELTKINSASEATAHSHNQESQQLQNIKYVAAEKNVAILQEELWGVKQQLNTAGTLLYEALSELEREKAKENRPTTSEQRQLVVVLRPCADLVKNSEKKFVDDVALDRITLQKFRCALNCKHAEQELKDDALERKDAEIEMLRGQGEGV